MNTLKFLMLEWLHCFCPRSLHSRQLVTNAYVLTAAMVGSTFARTCCTGLDPVVLLRKYLGNLRGMPLGSIQQVATVICVFVPAIRAFELSIPDNWLFGKEIAFRTLVRNYRVGELCIAVVALQHPLRHVCYRT